jgi:mRNA-degrading endonuclease YafQ of YafQ-DinJ toxin-antitoxin module
MPYKLLFTEHFTRDAKRFLQRHPDMARAYTKAFARLEGNPYHPSLRLRALSLRLTAIHSLSISLWCRITLHLLITEQEIVPIRVCDHDAVH